MSQPEMRSLQLLLFIWLLGVCGDSVHPEENNHLYDPLNPNIVLQCSNTPIEGKDGGRVILSCSTKDKMDISHDQVEWTFKDPTTGEDKSVHLYFQGEDYLHKQSDDFKDRTSLFKDQLSSGNCSLSLLGTTSHSGTYNCSVAGNLSCTVTLKVLPAGGDDSSQIHQEVTVSPDQPNKDTDGLNNWTTGHIAAVGVAVVAVVVGVAALIGLVVCRCRKNRNPRKSGTKSNSPQNSLELAVLSQQPPQDEENEPVDQNPNEEQIPLEVFVHQGH